MRPLARMRTWLPRTPLVIKVQIRRGRITREEWLQYAVEALRPVLGDVGVAFPRRIHVSVGFGGATGRYERTVGAVCFSRLASHDRVHQIFVSPVLGTDYEVLPALLHELIHAADDGESRHRGYFAKAHKAVGFKGSATGSEPGVRLDWLLERIREDLVAEHGRYPHAGLET